MWQHLADEAVHYGADRVYLCEAPELAHYRTRPYSRVCLKLIEEAKPEIVLFGATATGRDLAGAIATHLPTGLTADTTQLDVEPPPSRLLLASRPAFSEKMMATILCKQYRPQMATARAGVFQALPKDAARQGEIIRIEATMREEEIAAQVLDFMRETGKLNLEDAEIIVAGGRGLGGPDAFGCSPSWRMRSAASLARRVLRLMRAGSGMSIRWGRPGHGAAEAILRHRHLRRCAAYGRYEPCGCRRCDQQG